MEQLTNILFLATTIVSVYSFFSIFAIVYLHNRFKVEERLTEEELYILFKNRKQYD